MAQLKAEMFVPLEAHKHIGSCATDLRANSAYAGDLRADWLGETLAKALLEKSPGTEAMAVAYIGSSFEFADAIMAVASGYVNQKGDRVLVRCTRGPDGDVRRIEIPRRPRDVESDHRRGALRHQGQR